MYVQVVLFEEVCRHPERAHALARHAEGDLRRFTHHVAQLAGELEFALAVEYQRLDGHHLAADAGPGKTVDAADARSARLAFWQIAHRAEQTVQVLRPHAYAGRFLFLLQTQHRAAADAGKHALQFAHAGLARIPFDDGAHGAVRDLHFALAQAVGL